MTLSADPHVAVTEAFIAENPKTITLSRGTSASDGAGGTVLSSRADRPPQVMRMVGLNYRSTEASVVTVNGQEFRPQHALIAMPCADMEIGDQFTDGDKLYEVLIVQGHPEWRTRAEVFQHA